MTMGPETSTSPCWARSVNGKKHHGVKLLALGVLPTAASPSSLLQHHTPTKVRLQTSHSLRSSASPEAFSLLLGGGGHPSPTAPLWGW